MPDINQKLPLICGLLEALEAGFASEPLNYNRATRAAASGRFPATRAPNGRWWVLRSDLKAMVAGINSMPQRTVKPLASAGDHLAA